MKTIIYKLDEATELLKEETVTSKGKNPFEALSLIKNCKFEFGIACKK